MSRVFGAAALAPDASCNIEVASLTAAGQRREAQAARREALLQEYGLYSRWAGGLLQKCRERMTVDEQKAAATKVESERLAAAAAAASAVELAKKQSEEAAKKRLEEETRRAKELNAAAAERSTRELERRAAEVESLKTGQREAEDRARAERVDFEARAKAERDRANQEAEQKALKADEARALKERSDRTRQAKLQREQLLSDAELAYEKAVAEEDSKKRAAVDAVAANPAVAQATVAEAAQASHARVEAEKRLAEARVKAQRIEVDDSYERSRGHLGVLIGGGAQSFSGASGSQLAGSVGAMVTAHLGFWGEAPLNGLAWGFEVALAVRFSQPFPVTSTPRELEGHATARYFFGPLGVGAAGEFRVADPVYGFRAFGVGPSLGVAMVDTPAVRVLLSVNWLPVGVAVDLARVTGDLEVSWQWFTLRLVGGAFSQTGSSAIAWQAAALVGVRLSW
jgi:hypothetical protein